MSARGGTFTGTLRLARLALRRDRVQLPLWLLGTTAIVGATASSISGLYPTAREQEAYARSNVTSAVSRVFNGVVPDASEGGVVITEVFVIVAVAAVLMSIMAVVRHTRQNEETGRSELIGSAVVGRHAALTAALVVTVGADLVLAGLVAGVLAAGGLPLAGSLAAGAAVGSIGAVFAGIAAVTAQVTESARAASGLAAAVLGVAFLLRAAGDGLAPVEDDMTVTSLWPSWLSPIGWAQRVRPFGDEDWWPLALHAVLLAVLVVTAFRLTDHRDVGTGMLPTRRGTAGPRACWSWAWRWAPSATRPRRCSAAARG
jgi:ABC-2 type transport system permease protein